MWNVGVVYDPIDSFLDSDFRPSVHWLPPIGPRKFLADPFGILRKGVLNVLCEEFDYNTYKSRIVRVVIANGGFASQPEVVISRPFRLSYPYLVEHNGAVYCIPESHEAREISLYKMKNLPTKWVKVGPLIRNVTAVDATVFQHKGLWWLICSDANDAPLEKLFVWYSRNLPGPWMPHEANPVKSDIRSSRPAGTPFAHKGSLYRPAQDNSRTYGGRIVLNRVVELTPAEFEEKPVCVVGPYEDSPWPSGVHTLSAVGDITLLDAKRNVFVRQAFKHGLTSKFRKK